MWDCVMVDVYYDAVEILSPAWSMAGQDPEEHLSGRSKSPLTRNPLMAKTLYRSKEIEHYGTGIRRIKELCDEAGVGVEYRRTPDGTLLVFHRRDAFDGVTLEGLQSHGEGISETVNSAGETINETINQPNETISGVVEAGIITGTDEFAVLGFLAVHPYATYEVVADATGFSRAKVGRIIQSLREKSMLARDGSRKTGSWRVIQGGTHG